MRVVHDLREPHLLDRVGREHVVVPGREKRRPAAEILDRRPQLAGRRTSRQVGLGLRPDGARVLVHQVALRLRRRRRPGRPLEAERPDDQLVDDLGVRPSALPGDHLPEQGEGEVRIVVLLRRRQHELDLRHRLDQLLCGRRLAGDEHLTRLALEAGEVAEQAPDRRRAVRDPVQMLLEPVVEVELTLGPKLHHRRRGERLRDRADAVLRVRLRRGAVLVVGHPDRVRPDDLAVCDDRGRDARQPVRLPFREQAVECLKLRHGPPAPRARARPRGRCRPRSGRDG